MRKSIGQFLKSVSVFALLTGALGMVVLPMTAEIAEAKGGGGGGGGGGDKGDRGDRGNNGDRGGNNGRGSERSNGQSNRSNSSNAQPSVQAQQVEEEPVEEEPKNTHGKLASELKGLNAAHASETAMANASPNSMVGKIEAYRQAILAGQAAEAEEGEEEEGDVADGENIEEDGEAVAVVEGEEEPETDPLLELTGGRELSPEAINELHHLLGLDEIEPEADPEGEDVEGEPVAEGDLGEATEGEV